MKRFYRKALEEAGYPQGSEKYQMIERYFTQQRVKQFRDRTERKKAGITFNCLSAFQNEEGEFIDCFASDENVEEKILHELELEHLRECLNKIPKDDRDLLYRVFGGERGEVAKIAREQGVSYNDLHYRIKKLLKILRNMMEKEK